MNKTSEIFLQHILDSIELIEKRMEGVTFQKFDEDNDEGTGSYPPLLHGLQRRIRFNPR